MKRTLRNLCCIVLTLMLVITMTACGTSDNTNSQPVQQDTRSNANSSEPATITIWTLNRHDADYMNSVIQKINEEYDDINVEYKIYTENFEQAVEIAFATNEAPDILFDGGSIYSKFVGQGKFEPLDDYLTDEMKAHFGEENFLEGINMYNGKIYSLPAIGTTARLIYNKGIFERAGITEVPKTVDEMADTAIIISQKLKDEGIYGFAQNLKSPSGGLNRSVDFILMRSGGNYRGYDFTTGRYDFMPYKPILQAYQRMFTSGGAFPGCESLDIDPLRSQFANGKIGMYISWTHSEPGVYESQFPTTENWDVAQLPTIDGTVKGSQHMLLAGRWFLMNANSKNKDKAWTVMTVLYSDEVLKGYHENGLGNVTVKSVLDQITKQPDTIAKRPNLAFTDDDKLWPAAPSDLTSIVPEGKAMYDVFAELIFGVETDFDKALQDLTERYNKALDNAIADGLVKEIKYPNFNPKNPAAVFGK